MVVSMIKSVKNKALILLAFSSAAVHAVYPNYLGDASFRVYQGVGLNTGSAVGNVLQNPLLVAFAGVVAGAALRHKAEEIHAFFLNTKSGVFSLDECVEVEDNSNSTCKHEIKIDYDLYPNYGHGRMIFRLLQENTAMSEILFTIVHRVSTHEPATLTITKIDPGSDLPVVCAFELNAPDIEGRVDRSVVLQECPDTVKNSLKKLIQEIRARVLVK